MKRLGLSQFMLCYSLFFGIILINIETNRYILFFYTICYLLLSAYWASKCVQELEKEIKSPNYITYNDVASRLPDEDEIVPIIGEIPSDIYVAGRHATFINGNSKMILSVSALRQNGCDEEKQFIQRYMMTLEHEIFHNISYRYNLALTEEHINLLQIKLFLSPGHYSSEIGLRVAKAMHII